MIIDDDFLIKHVYQSDCTVKSLPIEIDRFKGIATVLVGSVVRQLNNVVSRDASVEAFIECIEKLPAYAVVHYWIIKNKPPELTTAMELSSRSKEFDDYYQELTEGKYFYPCVRTGYCERYDLVLLDTDFNNSEVVWAFIDNRVFLYGGKILPIGELRRTPYFDIKFFAKYYDYPMRPIEKLCETMQTGEVVYIPTGAGLGSLCVLAKNDIVSIDANLVNEVITFYYKHGGSVAITTPPKMFDYYFNLLITLLRGVEND